MSEYPTYLIHYGIQGQKWGVRRFQNEDGTLTPEGKQRYGINEKEARKLIDLEKKSPLEFYNRLNKNKAYRNFKNSNKDLKKYIDTSIREQMYKDAHNREANKAGKKAAKGWELGEALNYGRIDLATKYLDAGQKYMKDHAEEMKKEFEKYEKEKSESRKAFEKSGEKFIKDLFGQYGDMKLENPNSVSVNIKTGEVSQQTLSSRALTEMYRDKLGKLR